MIDYTEIYRDNVFTVNGIEFKLNEFSKAREIGTSFSILTAWNKFYNIIEKTVNILF